MKRLSFFLLIALALVSAIPALAQQNPDYILLDDATPAIDVVITLPADTTGTVSLNFAMAAVTLKDANDSVVFYTADERLHGLELNIAPNTGMHTLTVERLPGVAQAYVNVASLPEMTIEGDVMLTGTTSSGLNQESSLVLNADSPAGTLSISIPPETTALVTAQFTGISAQTQLVDSQGIVVVESSGHVDGLNMLLDGGEYNFIIINNTPDNAGMTGIRVIPIGESSFTIVEAPSIVATDTAITYDCTATITVNSVNLRSGPGTGYSVLGYAYRDEVLPAGGINPEQNWIVVGAKDGSSAWLSLSVADLSGSCDALQVFNIPLRDAAPAEIIITTRGNTVNATNNTNAEYYDDDDDHDDDDDDDDHDDDD